jgi:hypothetical protein
MRHLCMLSRSGRKLMTPVQVVALGSTSNGAPIGNNNHDAVIRGPNPDVSTAKPTAKPCRFFGTTEGCRKGVACQFRHA